MKYCPLRNFLFVMPDIHHVFAVNPAHMAKTLVELSAFINLIKSKCFLSATQIKPRKNINACCNGKRIFLTQWRFLIELLMLHREISALALTASLISRLGSLHKTLIASCNTSNCTEFQARRLNIRYKDTDGTSPLRREWNISCNPTHDCCDFENHQNADGTVNIPKHYNHFLVKNDLSWCEWRPKLIATDLDGTIVHHDGTISQRTIDAFSEHSQWVCMFICNGTSATLDG